jgi:shikimate kinase
MPENIALIGFSGCGKSSVGPALAQQLDMRFHDTDAILEKRYRMPVSRIFARHGEISFRSSEKDVIAALLRESETGQVIALGGGAFEDRDTRRLIKARTAVIYLSCSQRVLYRRLRDQSDRPLLGDLTGQGLRSDIKRLLHARRPHYLMADWVVSTTNRTVTETVNEITRKLATVYDNIKSTS